MYRHIATAICVLALCVPAQAELPSASTTEMGMEARLELTSTEILVGEPVYLRLIVTNVDQPYMKANFQSKLYPSEGNDIEIMVQPPGELAFRADAFYAGLYPSTELNLAPGQFSFFTYPILFDKRSNNGYVFAKAGEHFVTATVTFTVMRGMEKYRVQLGPVKITVREPQGRAAEAFKLLQNPEIARGLHAYKLSGPHLAAVTRVANEFTDTPYAPHALFAAGTSQFPDSNYQAAIEFFRRYVRQYPTHPLIGPVVFDIVISYDQLGDTGAARDWYYYLSDAVPGYDLNRPENPVAGRYYFDQMGAYESHRWWLYERPWEMTVGSTPKPQRSEQAQ